SLIPSVHSSPASAASTVLVSGGDASTGPASCTTGELPQRRASAAAASKAARTRMSSRILLFAKSNRRERRSRRRARAGDGDVHDSSSAMQQRVGDADGEREDR